MVDTVNTVKGKQGKTKGILRKGFGMRGVGIFPLSETEIEEI